MKKLFFLLILFLTVNIYSQYQVYMIVFVHGNMIPMCIDYKMLGTDTFYFSLDFKIKDCTSITTDDYKEVTKSEWDRDYLGQSIIIYYDNEGFRVIEFGRTYLTDDLIKDCCWPNVIYDRKRLYLSANR